MSEAAPEGPLRLRWRWIAAIVAVGVLLHVQALWIGYAGDDYVHLAMLDGVYPGARNPAELFIFFGQDPGELAEHVAFGTAPWWTVDEFYGGVLRPLASVLIWFDHAVAPGSATFAHAHSLVWWAATIAAAGLFLRRILPPWVAALALAIFAADDALILPIAWLANRAVLISASFSCVALWSHVRWRQVDWGPGPWVELGAWALAFAAGEYAISGAAFVLAYELVEGRRHGWGKLAAGLAPATTTLILYMTLHRMLGYGTVGSAVYVDPFAEPLAYLSWASGRIPRLWSELIFSVPANLGELGTRVGFWWAPWLGPAPRTPELMRAATILGVALTMLSLFLLRLLRLHLTDRRRWRLDWMVLGAALGLIPVAAAPAHGRLLVVPNLGACVAIAWVIMTALHHRHERPRPPWSRALAVFAVPMALAHLVLEPVDVIAEDASFRFAHERIRGALARPELAEIDFADKHVALVAASEPTTGIHGHLVLRAMGRDLPASWHVLSMTPRPHMLTRVGPRSLELASIGAPMLREPPERFFRPEAFPVHDGDTFDAGNLRATILEAKDGGALRVRFDFDHDLDPEHFVLLIAGPEGLMPIDVPAQGKPIPVPMPKIPGLGAPRLEGA